MTLTGAVLLYLLAIGPVKGFALTLGIATVIDIVVAYFYTRPAAGIMVRSPLGERGWFSVRAATGGDMVASAEAADLAEVAS